jgi:protein-S-isoprenylcysteine O-methyltransferase Ste14
MWYYLIDLPWIICIAVWVAGALKTRRTASKEPISSRLVSLVLLILGYSLVFSNVGKFGFLGERFMPRTWLLRTTGVVLTWLGIGLAIWARRHLGAYWSARVTIKENHQLIRTGPYARLRHPIYSGLGLAILGSVLVIDRWAGLLGFLLVGTAYWIKAKREESMLSAQFGEAFQEHCRQTGFLFPKLG